MNLTEWRRKERQIIAKLEEKRRKLKRTITSVLALQLVSQVDTLLTKLKKHRRNYPQMESHECD